MEKSEKVKLFEHIVYNQPVTKLYNFISTDIEFYEDGIGYNHKILFSNSKRSLGFILCIAYENNKYGDTLSIVIGKEDNVDIDEEPWFFLDDWLKTLNRKEDWKLFYLNVYEGSFEEKLKTFFAYLNGLFEDEELSKVLRGETWMNFDFDWRGMK